MTGKGQALNGEYYDWELYNLNSLPSPNIIILITKEQDCVEV